MPEIRVRYKDARDKSLVVRLIKTWRRGEIEEAVMSASSGPKEYFKNMVFAIFDGEPTIDAVSMVRAGGPPFFLVRQGQAYFDMSGREVEVQHRAIASEGSRAA